jgi:hypothetical protein
VRARLRGVLLTALGAVLALFLSLPAEAQDVYAANEPARALKDGKVVHAIRLKAAPPLIDGRLNDEAWTSAEAAINFVQRDPDNGMPATEATRLQFAYDDRYLYVAVTCLESAPDAIAAGLGRRDDFPSSDYVGIGFDPRHDHLTAYQFETNPSSVQRDFSVSDDDNFDFDYNAVWEVRTQITEQGWTAEFRIPFSQMRFSASPEAGQVWGLNSRRQIRRKGELGTWVPKPRGEAGEVRLFGHLVFDDPLAPARRVEILPYVASRAEREAGGTSELGAAGGVDMRVGLGSAATLAATVNPDFAQVEQDPAVLNLSVFETFFPEKRPFFLEDSRTFVPPYGLFQVFHSRRIGRAPGRLALPDDNEVVEKPDETTILGAAKVTGKSSGWTYGGLSAATGREYAIVDASGRRGQRLIEPATSYNVFRLQRDVLGGSSNVGGIVTGVVREKSDDAFTGGFDYNLRWDENRASFNGHWVATRAPGRDGVQTGGGGVTNFNFNRKYWNMWSHFDHFGRNFRVTDIGFFRGRTNRYQADGGFAIEQPDPGTRFRSYGASFCGGQGWNDERLVFDRWACANGFVTFLNFWNVNGGATRRFEALDDIDTRGGPPIIDPGQVFYFFNVNSDSRKSWRINFGGNGGVPVDGAGDRDRFSYATLTLQPASQFQFSISANYAKGVNVAQWIENRDTDGDGIDDNVYGTLRRNVVDVTLRGTYSINRDLTFQAYLQPFVAVGDYGNIRRLARPRSFEFSPVTIPDDPDFNTKSLRGNMVLRWEYLRGSTLFVVWDLSQSDESRPGSFNAFRDLGDAFRASANHVLMVKVSYWLNR